MHHPNSVLETHSKDHGFKVRSCSTEERKKIAQRNLSIINKSEEMRNHFSSQNVFLKSLDVITNLILILIFAVKEIILLVFVFFLKFGCTLLAPACAWFVHLQTV